MNSAVHPPARSASAVGLCVPSRVSDLVFAPARLFGFGFLLALVLVIAGCGDGSDVQYVTIWHQKTGGERAFFERVVDEYNATHSDHQIRTLYRETEELRNLFVIAAAGGKGPDLVFGPSDNVSILALTETIAPITEIIPDEFISRFTSEGIVSWKEKKWMLADQVGNHLMFVYNKDILPSAPQTLGEMVNMLDSVTVDLDGDGTIDRYGLTWNYTEPYFFIPFLTGFGGWMMDSEGNPTLDTPEMVAAVQYLLDLRDKYHLIPGSTDYDTAEAMFKTGRAAAIINGPWSWSGYESAGINYGLARLPFNEKTGYWLSPIYSAKGYSININTPEEKYPIVRSVVEYLTGPSMQTRMADELATIPVVESVLDSDAVRENQMLQLSLSQVESGRPMPTQPQLRQFWDGMRGPYQLIMNGAVSAEEGARLMQAEVEKRIRDAFL